MTNVAIIDYGMCNLDSVRRAVEECGGKPVVTGERAEIERADRIILPGVGAFPEAMQNLRSRGLDTILHERVWGHQTPFLGICLGMQLLAHRSEEFGEASGLGWIDGSVKRLQPQGTDTRVPHIGWNAVVPTRDSVLFRGIPSGKDFYMVHSYHFVCDNEEDVLARTPYCGSFVSAIERQWVFGVQFHPEKSQRLGFTVLRNFIRL